MGAELPFLLLALLVVMITGPEPPPLAALTDIGLPPIIEESPQERSMSEKHSGETSKEVFVEKEAASPKERKKPDEVKAKEILNEIEDPERNVTLTEPNVSESGNVQTIASTAVTADINTTIINGDEGLDTDEHLETNETVGRQPEEQKMPFPTDEENGEMHLDTGVIAPQDQNNGTNSTELVSPDGDVISTPVIFTETSTTENKTIGSTLRISQTAHDFSRNTTATSGASVPLIVKNEKNSEISPDANTNDKVIVGNLNKDDNADRDEENTNDTMQADSPSFDKTIDKNPTADDGAKKEVENNALDKQSGKPEEKQSDTTIVRNTESSNRDGAIVTSTISSQSKDKQSGTVASTDIVTDSGAHRIDVAQSNVSTAKTDSLLNSNTESSQTHKFINRITALKEANKKTDNKTYTGKLNVPKVRNDTLYVNNTRPHINDIDLSNKTPVFEQAGKRTNRPSKSHFDPRITQNKNMTTNGGLNASSISDGELKPIDGELKPTDGELKPTDGELKPTDGELKPTDRSEEKKQFFNTDTKVIVNTADVKHDRENDKENRSLSNQPESKNEGIMTTTPNGLDRKRPSGTRNTGKPLQQGLQHPKSESADTATTTAASPTLKQKVATLLSNAVKPLAYVACAFVGVCVVMALFTLF